MKQKKQKYLKSDETVRFHTFKVISPGSGELVTRIVVAIQKHDLVPHIGIAYCSVGDQFTKAKGRALAKGRMISKERHFVLTIPDSPKAFLQEVKEFIIEESKARGIFCMRDIISIACLK